MNKLNYVFEIRKDMLNDEYKAITKSTIFHLIEHYLKEIDEDYSKLYEKNIAFKLEHRRFGFEENDMYEQITLVPIDVTTIIYEPQMDYYNSKEYKLKEKIQKLNAILGYIIVVEILIFIGITVGLTLLWLTHYGII